MKTLEYVPVMMPTTIVKAKPWSTSPPKKNNASDVRSAVPDLVGRRDECGARMGGGGGLRDEALILGRNAERLDDHVLAAAREPLVKGGADLLHRHGLLELLDDDRAAGELDALGNALRRQG